MIMRILVLAVSLVEVEERGVKSRERARVEGVLIDLFILFIKFQLSKSKNNKNIKNLRGFLRG